MLSQIKSESIQTEVEILRQREKSEVIRKRKRRSGKSLETLKRDQARLIKHKRQKEQQRTRGKLQLPSFSRELDI